MRKSAVGPYFLLNTIIKGEIKMQDNIKNKYKLVFNLGVNRKLIRDYHIPVADIKADHECKDKTVFVYERTPEFEAAFEEINAQIKETKEAKEVE